MAFVVQEKESKPRELASADIHNAVVAEIVDLGLEDDKFNPGQQVHRGKAIIQIAETNSYGDRKEMHYWFNVTLGTAEKPSNLRKMVEGIIGRQLTPDEAKGYDIAQLQLAPCRIVVKHKLKQDKSGPTDYISEFLKPSADLLEVSSTYKPYAERGATADTTQVPF